MNPGTNNPEEIDYSKPVAYDNEGRPLYAHPPTGQQPEPQAAPAPVTQTVHLSRPLDPAAPEISPQAKARHEASVKKYPSLNLSDGEYIISAVRRHPIGLVPIVGFVGFMLAICVGMIPFYSSFKDSTSGGDLPSVAVVAVLSFLLMALFTIGGLIAAYVYINNKFFLTNESVIQEIQNSLFSKHEQTVSLQNIEDASYRQENILQAIFNYGSIRLSTEGDETTYRFNYVANPKQQIAILNNAVEAFKNGRPILDD